MWQRIIHCFLQICYSFIGFWKTPSLGGVRVNWLCREHDKMCLISKSEYRNPKQIQNSNVPILETNTPICILEAESRIVQFRSFGFWSFDIALRPPVVKISVYNRPLWVVSLSNHFEFRISRFVFYILLSDTPHTPMGCCLKATLWAWFLYSA